MVAFVEQFAPKQGAVDPENRTGDFFGRPAARASDLVTQVLDRAEKSSPAATIARRGAALAQEGQGIRIIPVDALSIMDARDLLIGGGADYFPEVGVFPTDFSGIEVGSGDFDLPLLIDTIGIGLDVASGLLIAADVVAAGPTGEGIGPAIGVQAGKTEIQREARKKLIRRLLEATRNGREIHKAWKPGRGFQKEFCIPGAGRADAVDLTKMVIKELKPNNPRAIRAGMQQLQRYIRRLEELYPHTKGKWKAVLETYP